NCDGHRFERELFGAFERAIDDARGGREAECRHVGVSCKSNSSDSTAGVSMGGSPMRNSVNSSLAARRSSVSPGSTWSAVREARGWSANRPVPLRTTNKRRARASREDHAALGRNLIISIQTPLSEKAPMYLCSTPGAAALRSQLKRLGSAMMG